MIKKYYNYIFPPDKHLKIPNKLWSFVWFIVKDKKIILFVLSLLSICQYFEGVANGKMLGAITTWVSITPIVSLSSIFYKLLYFTTIILLINFVFLLHDYILGIFIPYIEAKTKFHMLGYIQQYKYEYFSKRNEGEIGNCVIEMVDGIANIIHFILDKFLPTLFQSIILIISMCLIDWRVAIFLVIGIVGYGIVMFIMAPKACLFANKLQRVQNGVIATMIDSIRNSITKKILNMEKYEMEYIKKEQDVEFDVYVTNQLYVNKMYFFLIIIYSFFQVFAFSFIILYVWHKNIITSSKVIELLTLNGFFSMSLWRLCTSLSEFLTTIGQCAESLKLIDPTQLESINHTKSPIKKLIGNIEFKNVTCKGNRLNNINFSIKSGEVISIIGKSGSGKTSLAYCLLNLLDYEGLILIDGENVKNLSRTYLGQNILFFDQKYQLFSRSIRENILCGKDNNLLDKHNINELLPFVMDKKEQYNYSVGPGGVNLSGGEQQRIGIARNLIRDSSIIVCDEITSALDQKTRDFFIKFILKKFNGCTIIFITHDTKLLEYSDRIIEIEKGQILSITPNINKKN